MSKKQKTSLMLLNLVKSQKTKKRIEIRWKKKAAIANNRKRTFLPFDNLVSAIKNSDKANVERSSFIEKVNEPTEKKMNKAK